MTHEEAKKQVSALAQQCAGNILIYGKRGLGQEDITRQALKDYLCTGDHLSSCSCRACRTPLEQNPDVLTIKAKDKRTIKVDDIEVISDFLDRYPAISRTRVVVIDGIDRLTTQAENALLKEIEEGQAKYICLAYSESVLETIVSRCSVFSLNALGFKAFARWCCADSGADAATVKFWYAATHGCPGLVNKIKEEKKEGLFHKVYEAFKIMDKKALLSALGLFKEKDRDSVFIRYREEITPLVEMMLYAVSLDIEEGNINSKNYELMDKLGKEIEESKRLSYTASDMTNLIISL